MYILYISIHIYEWVGFDRLGRFVGLAAQQVHLSPSASFVGGIKLAIVWHTNGDKVSTLAQVVRYVQSRHQFGHRLGAAVAHCSSSK